MGLAPYGEPRYRDLILENLIDLKEDGSYRLDMRYFNYCQGLTMTSDRFHQLFGGPPRKPESQMTQREMDLAASIQSVTEEVMLRTARHVRQETGQENLVLAGGVALNCVGNGRILRESGFKRLWIQPAAGDAGGALGAAWFVWHQLLERPRTVSENDQQQGSTLGPAFSDEEIQAELDKQGAVYEQHADDESLCRRVASLIAEDSVVGWFQGRMEFGPRALGSRSILGDARSQSAQTTMNLKIKFRESFRPFAPLVLQEDVSRYFEMRPEDESPYMLIVANVNEELLHSLSDEDRAARGFDKLRVVRSQLPAITHVDNSARIQTVDSARQPLLTKLLREFREQTGCSVMINTSFNVRSEPIVCTPNDAWRCFAVTDMDVLVLGRFVVLKEKQQLDESLGERESHLAQFELD